MTIRDPEYFRGMTPGAMLQTMILDAADERHKAAKAAGARCHRCIDTGLDYGVFCSCEAGRKLARQANAGHRGPEPSGPGVPSNTPSGTGSGKR